MGKVMGKTITDPPQPYSAVEIAPELLSKVILQDSQRVRRTFVKHRRRDSHRWRTGESWCNAHVRNQIVRWNEILGVALGTGGSVARGGALAAVHMAGNVKDIVSHEPVVVASNECHSRS